jgi:hypothetical protein
MGEKPADTEREIVALRGDMSAALDELEKRLKGGLRSVASTEARITSGRAAEEAAEKVVERARQNPTLLGVAGVVVAGAVAYGAFAFVNGLRERNSPKGRLKRGVKHVRGELSETAERVAERLEQSRRQLERGLLPSGVLLKLEPEDGGYVRVSDARLEPPASKKRGGRSPVIKKFIWAALLSIFMAVGSVLARRIAESVWQAMTHEEPPTEKSKVEAR